MIDEEPKFIFEEKYVRTEIIEERGRWVVFLEIGGIEESVRHRIQDYSTNRLAEIAAKIIKRTAERDEPFKNFDI